MILKYVPRLFSFQKIQDIHSNILLESIKKSIKGLATEFEMPRPLKYFRISDAYFE